MISGSHRQKRKPQRSDSVGITKHKRNDDGICENGRKGGEKYISDSSQLPGSKRRDQSGKRAENDVRNGTARQDVADQTADEQSGDCGGGKKGKDGKSFRETDLNGIVRESKGVGYKGEHNVEGGYHCRLGEQVNVLLVHLFFSFSFVLRVEGLEHSAHFALFSNGNLIQVPDLVYILLDRPVRGELA